MRTTMIERSRPILRLIRGGEQPGKRPLEVILGDIRSTIRGLKVDWQSSRHFTMLEDNGWLHSRVEWKDPLKTGRDGSPKIRVSSSSIPFFDADIQAKMKDLKDPKCHLPKTESIIEQLIELESHITCYLGAAQEELSVTQLNNRSIQKIKKLKGLIGELKMQLMETR